ncbi:PIN domain-like protein [Mycena maculata]|uniref:PIN domain-like protein n=1 Tax=Mycena maculata TaxID=230809 RepID=A0AAD7NR52_9AGAR|nr:PIN domain-like protein [Mycena maculata]
MGANGLWEIVKSVAQTRSLLNLATIDGFQTDNRGLRTFVVGIDVRYLLSSTGFPMQYLLAFSIQIYACLAAHNGDQVGALETLFYQLCNLSRAPVTAVFVFDGPGRPNIKRGVHFTHRSTWLIAQLKVLITAFGYHYHEAPGEAEYELSYLNKLGAIDAVITEDSDALVFGAKCIIRTLGLINRPSVEDDCLVYKAEHIESSGIQLSKGGLLLYVLLAGGDYNPGVTGCGPTIAHALSKNSVNLGTQLLTILSTYTGAKLETRLDRWRDVLRSELQTNASGQLTKRYPKMAAEIPDTFPDVSIARMYLKPLSSWSPQFTGITPDSLLWVPTEPSVPEIAIFCRDTFGWNGNDLLKKFKNNLWSGVAFRMFSSVWFHLSP